MIDYAQILSVNYSDKHWGLHGTSYDGLIWKDASSKPTQAELDALWQSTQDAIRAKAYIAKRAAEYPPMSDYLDGVVKGDQQQIDAYIAKCLEVKAKYPK